MGFQGAVSESHDDNKHGKLRQVAGRAKPISGSGLRYWLSILNAMFLRLTVFHINGWSWVHFFRGFRLAVLLGLFLITVPGMRPDLTDKDFVAAGVARNYLFDFAQWEGDTLTDKLATGLLAPERYMTAEQRVEYVREYLKLVNEIADLERQVEDIYVNPSIDDPAAASADLRARRDALRADQHDRQPIAEAIIQSQVSEMLVEYGFGVGDTIIPSVSIRFTELPTMMILSDRDHIERIGAFPLEHGLTVDQMEQLEQDMEKELDVSALVVPIGGLGVYPAMLIETGWTSAVYEIAAHEWTHHYLALFPLGSNYGLTPDLYTMNETTANIVGNEIGWAILNRYYPDLAGPPPDYTPLPATVEQPAQTPTAGFNFNREMHKTRVITDALLAAGDISGAERYMEARRLLFIQNGYSIRKLNQAYFAFYGSYADSGGATGSDPVGPALRNLRYYSQSLFVFVTQVREITSFEQLEAVLEAARQKNDAEK